MLSTFAVSDNYNTPPKNATVISVGLVQSQLEEIHLRIKCSLPRWIETVMHCPNEILDSASIKHIKRTFTV